MNTMGTQFGGTPICPWILGGQTIMKKSPTWIRNFGSIGLIVLQEELACFSRNAVFAVFYFGMRHLFVRH